MSTERNFMGGYDFQSDEELIQEVYRRFDEDSRLNRSQAARVEFLTNIRYIERHLKPGDRILDVGAGAGEYSLYFGRRGTRSPRWSWRTATLPLSERSFAQMTPSILSRETPWI